MLTIQHQLPNNKLKMRTVVYCVSLFLRAHSFAASSADNQLAQDGHSYVANMSRRGSLEDIVLDLQRHKAMIWHAPDLFHE